MAPRYRIVWGLCALLALSAAVVGPIVAIRVLNSSDARSERASARITGLQAEITQLEASVANSAADSAALHQVVDALSAQIVRMGGQPVVVAPPSVTPTTATPATTIPTTTTTTTKPCRLGIGEVCIAS